MKTLETYLLNTVYIEDERLPDGIEYRNEMQKMYHVAMNELGRWLNQGKSEKEIVTDWLLGLGCNIAFTYHDISNILKDHGHDAELSTDGEYQTKHYWKAIAELVVKNK